MAIALDMAARGFHVFPVVAGGKIPAIKRWQDRATRNPAQIRAFWADDDPVLGVTRERPYNVGIRAGRFGDDGWVVVCDVDVKAGAKGAETLSALDMEHGEPGWLDTLTVDTPSGGVHHYFLTAEPAATSASKLGPGLDTRGEGGYVLAPGSVVNGKPYVSRGGTLRAAPDWLVEAIGRPAPRLQRDGNVVAILDTQPALDRGRLYLTDNAPKGVPTGQRGSTAYRTAAKVKDYGVSELACLELMADHWNEVACEPPMEFEDLAASVAHAYEYGRLPIGASHPAADFEPATAEDLVVPGAPAAPRLAIEPTPFTWRDPRTIPKRRWLYGKHYIRRYVSATVAPGGVGKSSLTIVEALAIATGRALLGVEPKERGRVWLWNGEDPHEEIERRIAAACLHFDVDPGDLDGWLFVDSGRTMELVIATTTRDGTKVAAPVRDALIEAFRRYRIDVGIFDPFVSSHRVSENDNMAIDAVVKTWMGIADATGAGIELVHHARKTGGEEVTIEDSRGASALVSAARAARVLNRMSKDEAKRAGVDRPRSYFKVGDGKANLAPPAEHAEWYRLVGVPLLNGDEPLDEGDEVAVVTTWRWQDPGDTVLPAHLRAVMDRIAAGKWRQDVRAKDWVGIPVAAALDLDAADDKARIKDMIAGWVKRGLLAVVERLDDRRMPRDYVECVSNIETKLAEMEALPQCLSLIKTN